MSVNRVILIGNVGQDPRVKYFDTGSAVATFPLATTDRGYTLQNGTQIPERTEWHNIVASNRLAEIVDKYVHKGDKLYLEGKIRTRSYSDQSGSYALYHRDLCGQYGNVDPERGRPRCGHFCTTGGCNTVTTAAANATKPTAAAVAGATCTR